MLLENEESIFEVKVNAEGASSLESVGRLARILFITSLIYTLMVMASYIFRYVYFQNFDVTGNVYLFIETRIYPVASIAIGIANYYQWILYIRFTRQCSQSIRNKDQHTFNQSFKTMRKSMRILVWLLFVNLIFGVYSLFASIRDYLHQN